MSAAAMPAAAVAAAVLATREFLRIEGLAEQALLERLADSAMLLGEAFTGTLFLARAVEEIVPATPEWRRLAAEPVTAIETVLTRSPDAAPIALATDGYAIDIDADGRGWLRTLAAPTMMVTVRYTAGLASDWASLPAPIAQGVIALAAHLFDDRASASQPPAAVAALWRPWRRMRIAAPELHA